MTQHIPNTPTETIRADQITAGRTILTPVIGEPETVTHARPAVDPQGNELPYVLVHTTRTGPDHAYMWPAGTDIVAVTA